MDTTSITLKELEARFRNERAASTDLAALEADPRAGVRRLAASLRRREEERERERRRLASMLERETRLRESGISYVAGVDEVGVGPFAGPVVACAVVFAPGVCIEGVRDSKQLTHGKRVALDKTIRGAALGVGIGLVDTEEIDRLNIHRAALKAMRLAILDLGIRVQYVLVDGRFIPDIGIPQDAVVAGDSTVFSIAAASIVAKVYRDGLMCDYDRRFPQYGFARHKGYGTAEHLRALGRHGPCEIHRRSFDWRAALGAR